MEIYVITKGDYDDYRILGVATDKEKAKLYADVFSDRFDVANVEIHHTEAVDSVNVGDKPWICKYDNKTLNCLSIERCADPCVFERTKYYADCIAIRVFASTLEEAAYKSRVIVEGENGNPAN